MLSEHNPADVERALRAAPSFAPFPPAADRAAWTAVRARLGDEATELIASAAQLSTERIAARPASLYLDWLRNPTRDEHEFDGTLTVRRTRLAHLTLAECLEYEGRFLDPLLDTAWSLCEESSWAHPTHVRGLPDLDRPVIDLRVAMTALELAELDYLLGDRLDPLLRKRIRREVNQRCFTPFLTRHDYWWMYNTAVRGVNNWTGVCVGGVIGAATYLEDDPARLAELITRGARSLDDYLATFDQDGGSSEGPGYWSYGFGYYTIVAQLVERRTGGQVDFLAGERLGQIARYPLRTILSPDTYVNFSDCDRRVGFSSTHLAFLSRHLAMPELMTLANRQTPGRRRDQLTWGLRSLFWLPDPAAGTTIVPEKRDFFGGMHWLIARYDPADPDALVLAAKGGHNQEMHNQNDVGAVIVHLGRESVITDPGRGRYTQAYFGPKRYEHFVNSSLGHATLVPNGQAQLPGAEHRAELLAHEATEAGDSMTLELHAAYPPEADLAALRRTITLHRELPRGAVTLEDSARFASGPGMLESVLITFGQADIGAEAVTVREEHGALRVNYEPDQVVAWTEVVPQVDLAEGPADVTRIIFGWREPAREGAINLRLTPA